MGELSTKDAYFDELSQLLFVLKMKDEFQERLSVKTICGLMKEYINSYSPLVRYVGSFYHDCIWGIQSFEYLANDVTREDFLDI